MRIDIVGLPASGKSTFARAVAKKLSIPHIHLDQFWFESGGKQGRKNTPHLEEVRDRVRQKTIRAIDRESWVSDGTYLHVQDLLASRADHVIFLDIPLLTRLRGHFKRVFMEPKELTYVSFWDDITFFWELVKRTVSSKPKLVEFVEQYQSKVTTLRSWKEINQYLETL